MRVALLLILLLGGCTSAAPESPNPQLRFESRNIPQGGNCTIKAQGFVMGDATNRVVTIDITALKGAKIFCTDAADQRLELGGERKLDPAQGIYELTVFPSKGGTKEITF